MDKKILMNLKNAALCAAMPLLMVACAEKNNNVDAELADVDAKMALIEDKLDAMVQETDSLLKDSLSRDPIANELHDKIALHKKELKKLKAPQDTVKMKRVNKKLFALTNDSTMNAYKVKEQIIKNRKAEFNVVYKENDALRVKHDSLMKIKSRQR